MKNTFKTIISLCFGGVIGSCTTYFLLKKKFNDRIDIEVQSIKDKCSIKGDEDENLIKEENPYQNKVSTIKNGEDENLEKKSKYITNSIKKQEERPTINYSSYYANSNRNLAFQKEDDKQEQTIVVFKKNTSKKSAPVVISPNEFEEDENYNSKYLTYYSDGVLADAFDNRVDIGSTIGIDALSHFGEYEDDLLHIRDDEVKVYYEVIKDSHMYSDVALDNRGLDEED